MKLNYQRLLFDGKKWEKSSIELIKNMLEVWDKDHKIVVSHPNLVFNNKPIKFESGLDCINFEDIKENIKDIQKCSYINFYPEASKTWKHIYQRFYHEVFELKTSNTWYLAIVEFDQKDNVLVRGIFKANKKDIFVAINPLYESYRPKNISEKNIRLISDYITFDQFLNEQKNEKIKKM